MKINETTFEELPTNGEGFVFMGCGSDLNEWVTGIPRVMKDENVIKDNDPFLWNIYKLVTTGGRIDLLFLPKQRNFIDLGKAAIWRLKFGDCSWLSDYLVNYADQHLIEGH